MHISRRSGSPIKALMTKIDKAIFLSYASQDADAARRICEALRAAGLEVWFDQSELRGGDAWDASIRKQIKECALFIPIISANTNAREEGYFRREWNLAVNRMLDMAEHKAFLLPVILGGVSEPDAVVPDKFRERQWSRLTSDDAIAGFAQRAAKLLAGSGASGISAPNAAPSGHSGEGRNPAHLSFQKLGTDWVPASAGTTRKSTTPSQDTPSIAVLAFANRSASADDEYFSDGLADELLNVLAKISGLRVAARTSAFSFKGKQTTVGEIGRILNVATVLEGSVRKSGNRVRISVQLVKVADGYHLWSETYDRTLDDIFAVQDDIAQAVLKELHTRLIDVQPGAAASAALGDAGDTLVATASVGRTANAEAQRLYMQGRYLLGRKSAEDLTRSIEYLQEAVTLDPGFALAWATLSQAHHDTGGWGLAPVAAANSQALAAAEKALALAPDLVEAHLSLAAIQLSFQFDWTGGQASIRRALELAPENADVLTVASRLHFCVGRLDESVALGQRAIARDPLNAQSHRVLAITQYSAGDLDSAVSLMKKSLELSPDSIASRHILAIILGLQGHHEEALAEAMREKAEWARLTATSVIKWLMNDPAASNQALARLVEKYGQDSAVQIAYLYALRNAADESFAWLERAFLQRDAGLVLIKSMPFFCPVHNDPRWAAFLKKMGFPE